MKLIRADLWEVVNNLNKESKDFLVLIPTNGIVIGNNNPHLVMGAGLAKDANTRFPRLDYAAGQAIKYSDKYILSRQVNNITRCYKYGFIEVDRRYYSYPVNYTLGLLQTKEDWKDNSSIALLEWSIVELKRTLVADKRRVYMPIPGVGLGGLDKRVVIEHIRNRLEDRYTVCQKDA